MRWKIGLLVMWLWWPLALLAQTLVDEQYVNTYELETRVLLFQEELNELYFRSTQQLSIDYDETMSEGLLQSVSNDISSMEATMQSIGTRLSTFMQATQNYIAMDDSLLNRVADVQTLQQTVNEAVAKLRQQFDQIAAFNRAEVFVFGQDSIYSSLYRRAMSLTISAKLQAELEKVKAAEQLQFADVQKHYDEAKQTAEAFEQFRPRMERLESKYLELKVVSGKIQEAAYMPLLQRIKDYLMNIAAVSIVLMFFNMVLTRIKSFLKLRSQAEKMKNTMGGQQNYPTI